MSKVKTHFGRVIIKNGRASCGCCREPNCCMYANPDSTLIQLNPEYIIEEENLPSSVEGLGFIFDKIPSGQISQFGGYYQREAGDSLYEIRPFLGGWEIVRKQPNQNLETVWFSYCLFDDKLTENIGIFDRFLDNYKTTYLGPTPTELYINVDNPNEPIPFDGIITILRNGLCSWYGEIKIYQPTIENPEEYFEGVIRAGINYDQFNQEWTASQAYELYPQDLDSFGGIKYPAQNTPVGDYYFNNEFVLNIF